MPGKQLIASLSKAYAQYLQLLLYLLLFVALRDCFGLIGFLQRLAKRIKDLRIKAGYTSYETFAYEAGISRTMYGNYENGSDMRTTNLRKIAKAHNMTLQEFFSEGFD